MDDRCCVSTALQAPHNIARALILALGVCYHACLQTKRKEYRIRVCKAFADPLQLPYGQLTMEEEISL